jgi:hypothetical protein
MVGVILNLILPNRKEEKKSNYSGSHFLPNDGERGNVSDHLS